MEAALQPESCLLQPTESQEQIAAAITEAFVVGHGSREAFEVSEGLLEALRTRFLPRDHEVVAVYHIPDSRPSLHEGTSWVTPPTPMTHREERQSHCGEHVDEMES
jgi:hypothetical protein